MTRAEAIDMLAERAMPNDELFAKARAVRMAHFQHRAIIRGVIEVTNRCRVNCTFCPMRRDNTRENTGFMLDEDLILAAALEIRKVGINVILLQGGEIPQTTPLLERCIPRILELFQGGVEILLNLGNKTRAEYARLKRAGAYSYILKHESSDPELYQRLKFETLESRLRCIEDLLDLGFKVGTGCIIGLPGQNLNQIADDILLAKRLGVHMMSASPFIPAPRTPLENHPPGSVPLTLRTIAVTRLTMPGALVPSVSALEANQAGGQNAGLHAGANVMTINFTPEGLRDNYLIYGANRFVVKFQHVQQLLQSNNLRMAASRWIPKTQSAVEALLKD